MTLLSEEEGGDVNAKVRSMLLLSTAHLHKHEDTDTETHRHSYRHAGTDTQQYFALLLCISHYCCGFHVLLCIVIRQNQQQAQWLQVLCDACSGTQRNSAASPFETSNTAGLLDSATSVMADEYRSS